MGALGDVGVSLPVLSSVRDFGGDSHDADNLQVPRETGEGTSGNHDHGEAALFYKGTTCLNRRDTNFFPKKMGPTAVHLMMQLAYILDREKPTPGKGRIHFHALLGHAIRGTTPRRPP